MKKTFIGIDVSSATLDICIRTGKEQKSVVINNDPKAIARFF